ncbi:MAG TPA: hypothetical protein VI006_18090 [Solirubrobacteraceae bacterium]
MTNRTIPIILAASAALAAGCGSGDDPESNAAKPAATAAAKIAAPYGTYVREVNKADLARTDDHRDESGPHQSLPPVGEYRLVIAQGAGQDVIKVTDSSDEPTTIAMDLTAEDGLLRLTSYVNPDVGAFCGPEIAAPARYTFEASGSTLALEPSRPDLCADRDSILTGTWTKG